jgi:hypothetical protein
MELKTVHNKVCPVNNWPSVPTTINDMHQRHLSKITLRTHKDDVVPDVFAVNGYMDLEYMKLGTVNAFALSPYFSNTPLLRAKNHILYHFMYRYEKGKFDIRSFELTILFRMMLVSSFMITMLLMFHPLINIGKPLLGLLLVACVVSVFTVPKAAVKIYKYRHSLKRRPKPWVQTEQHLSA